MARYLIVKPEASFHTLFHAALALAGYVAIDATNSYEGRPAADVACLADSRMDLRLTRCTRVGGRSGAPAGQRVSTHQKKLKRRRRQQ